MDDYEKTLEEIAQCFRHIWWCFYWAAANCYLDEEAMREIEEVIRAEPKEETREYKTTKFIDEIFLMLDAIKESRKKGNEKA